MVIRVSKKKRLLTLWDGEREIAACPIALGRSPTGAKERESDGKTPEGIYHICLVKENGRHGQSLGLDYPSPADADAALKQGRIDTRTHAVIVSAHQEGRRPPWGTPLGGEIYLHAGGVDRDWTQGCIALKEEDMARLFALRKMIERVEIRPE